MSTVVEERLTFERFVVGPTNRVAAAAARRVAESPGTSYNPLVIHGAAGLGKTHLLSAIRHLARQVQPSLRVRQESLEAFMDQLSAAIAAGAQEEFRAGYQALDLLLLDDAQFLAGHTRTQEELLRIWDVLASRGAQVVLALDRAPQEIDHLDVRLGSRFSGGLIIDITPPELETKLAIVKRRAEERRAELAPGVADAIARLPLANVRELHGALNRVIAVQEIEGRRIHADEVTDLLGIHPAAAPQEDEFVAFLSDITETVAEVVDGAPWRRQLAQAILRWEAEGIRTRRLENALEADTAPDVDALLTSFEAEVAELGMLRRALEELGDPLAADPLVLDPDRLEEARAALGSARVTAARAPAAVAPEPTTAPAAPAALAAPAAVDSWYFNGEKLALGWLALEERIVEELG